MNNFFPRLPNIEGQFLGPKSLEDDSEQAGLLLVTGFVKRTLNMFAEKTLSDSALRYSVILARAIMTL